MLAAPLQCDMASYLTARHCVHQVADDEGYLPLHLALDCARPNPTIAKMLLDHYPESAFHKSKDGLLPIHCIISSLNPVIEVIELLLQIFPDSTESMAVDVIPGQLMFDALACLRLLLHLPVIFPWTMYCNQRLILATVACLCS
jgi:hypothetical protein